MSGQADRSLDAWEGMAADPFAVLEADVIHLLKEAANARFSFEESQAKTTAEARRFLLVLVEILDAFDRVFRAVAAKEDQITPQMKIWLGNFRTVRRIVEATVTAEGAVRMENPAEGFDPQWHKVAELKPDPSRADGTILEIEKPGYIWRKEVLRKAEVIVVRNEE